MMQQETPTGMDGAGDSTGNVPPGAGERAPLTSGSSDVSCLIAECATGIGRAGRQFAKVEIPEGDDRLRAVHRHLEATRRALAARGVEVRDHTGQKYVPGMALSVIAFQPTPGTTIETVLETIKPTVYFRDQLIQRGEVIVAAAPQASTSDPDADARHPGPAEASTTKPDPSTKHPGQGGQAADGSDHD